MTRILESALGAVGRLRSAGWTAGWTAPAGLAGLSLIALLSCAGTPDSEPPSPAGAPGGDSRPATPLDRFGPERAWAHLEAIVAGGPRPTGSPGSAAARRVLEQALFDLGAKVQELKTPLAGNGGGGLEAVHVQGVIPGRSEDVILLAAPYDSWSDGDSAILGANDGASGPALVLELARALVARERPYTLWLLFIDGDSAESRDSSPGHRSLSGSRALARDLSERGALDRVRLAVFFNQVADPDLQLARDLRSHRSYREMFFESARALGHPEVIPSDPAFETPEASHEPFLDVGLRRVVAIVDDRFGGTQSPGVYWRSKDDDLRHVSVESMGIAGQLSLDALRSIEARLQKIDRFAERPLDDPPPPPSSR